jgi:hypothetical protein
MAGISTNTIRKITIQGEGQQSLDSLASSLNKVATATQGVASVTDIQTKRALSVADAYKRQTLALVDGARAQDQLTRSVKILDQALAQGVVKTTAEYNQRLEALQQKYGQVSNAGQTLASVTGKLGQIFNVAAGAAAAFGVVLGVGALVQFGKQVFSTTADLQEQADQVLGAGGNVEAFQALHAVFLTNGISMEAGDKILGKLTRSLGEAEEGSKKAQDAFHKMGLGAKELAGTTADAALPLVAQKLLEITDGTKRAALEVAIFGKSGQQLESALRALAAGGISDLIARGKELGIVIDEDLIKKADDAKDSLALAFTKLQVVVAPIVVKWGEGFAALVGDIDKTTKSLGDLWDKAKLFAGIGVGARVGFAVGGLPGAALGAAVGAVGVAASRGDQYQKAVSNYDAQLAGGGLSPSERADITARRDRAIELLNPTVGNTGLVTNDKRNNVERVTVTASRTSGASWAPNSDDLENAKRLKETFDSYLAAQEEAARVSSQTNLERQTEAAVIKAAQIAQNEADKEHDLKEKDLVKTYDEAAKILGQQRTEKVRIAQETQITAPLERDLTNQIKLGAVALAAGRDQRALAVEIAQKELTIGRELTEKEKERLAIRQQQIDATAMRDYLDDLREEVQLAGMAADDRERESAVLRAMHASHGTLKADQADDIRGLITARQETERWRGVVDDISSGFQSFFEDVLNNGKLSFSSLWDSIKQSFVKMLAYMATQALVAPIIVPIVGGIAGSLGSLGSLFGGSGGGGGISSLALGASGMGGGGLFGQFNGLAGTLSGPMVINGIGGPIGTIGGGIGSSISSLGSSLFGGGAGEALGGGDFIGSALDTGGIFGTAGLGAVLGGFGVGSLASSLIFGNKNDAGLGGMGGAAAGALIGSIIPGVGTIIGGLLGGLAGGGLGSLTGSSNQGAISNFTNNGLGNTLFKSGGGNNGQLATTASGNINTALKALQDAGVNVSLGNISGLSIGSDKSYVYDFAGGKQKLAGGEAGVQATVNAILDRILPSASSGDDAVNALLQKYGGLNSGNLGAFSTELQAQQAQKAQDEAIKAQQDQQAAAQATADAAKALADQFNTLGDDLKGFASGLQDSAKAAHDAVTNWEKARDNLTKANQALLVSAPGLSPVDQYRGAQAQFEQLLNSARGGNSQSANDLGSFAGQFLQTSYQYNGSSGAYNSDLSVVKGILGDLAGFSDAQRSYAQRQADALDASVAQLSAIYAAIGTAANQNNEGLATLRAEFAELSQSIKDGNLQDRMAS